MEGQLKRAKREQRDRIADYFSEMGTIMSEAAGSLRREEVPHGLCERIFIRAQNLPEQVGDVIGKDEANEYAKQLVEAHDIELAVAELLGKTGSSLERAQGLADLEKASALFSEMASDLRVSD